MSVGRILALQLQGELSQRHGSGSRHFPTVLSPTHAASDETGYAQPCDEEVGSGREDNIGLAPSAKIPANIYQLHNNKTMACASVMGWRWLTGN